MPGFRLPAITYVAVSAVAFAWASAAQARDAATEPPTSGTEAQSADTRGDIIVTAQRRSENLQDVPLSVAVVGGDKLGSLKLNETSDLQYLVPGVTLTNAAGPRNFGFFIRGIGTSTFSSEAIEGSVAYVVDGVVMGQAGSSLGDLPDVERIEVLRGPQGTLFGKNASAGVINVVTRRPSKEFTGNSSMSWGWPDNDRRFSAYLSGPITDNLRFSLSGRRNRRDGYIDNVFDGRKLNDRNDWGVRGKLEWEPTSNLTLTGIADYYKRTSNCCVWTLYSAGSPAGVPELLQQAVGITPGIDNLKQNIDGDVFSNAKSKGVSFQADYRFGGFTLTSITAWRTWETTDGLDSDSSPLNLLDVNYAHFTQAQFSQEVRLASPTGRLVDYVLGAYYFDADVNSRSAQIFATVPLPFFNRRAHITSDSRNMALFGQADLNISKSFKLIGGLRYLRDRVEAAKDRLDPTYHLTDSDREAEQAHALVWRAGAQYNFNKDVNVFATVTRGFKGGGFDTNIGNGILRYVKPERPTNYELGLRTYWPDTRVTFNITAFYTHVDNYQTAGRDPITATYPIVSSEAKTKGVEFDLNWRPLGATDLNLALGGSYIDARWGDFPNAPCFGGQTIAEGCVAAPGSPAGAPGVQQNLTDAALPYAPKWQLNAGGSYGVDLSPALKMQFDLSASYRSSELIAFPNNPRTRQAGYLLINGAVALANGKTWKLSVYGKNLLDKHYAITMFSTPFGSARSLSQFRPYESQRSVGFSLDVGF
mgnify:CR=1 FL=1